jgi:hypothetical protein
MRSIFDAWLTELNVGRKETTACQEATETKTNPGMIQSIEEHQEIPKGEAAGKPVRVPRKRSRVRNMAAEGRQKRKERTRGNRGSRRKLSVACSKVSRREKVAWRKRYLIRKMGTLEMYGLCKEFATAGIRTTRCAEVARCKERSTERPSVEQGRRKNHTRNKFASGIRKGWTFGKETSGGSERHHWCEGSKHKTMAASKEREESRPNIREDFQTADREARRRIFCSVTED